MQNDEIPAVCYVISHPVASHLIVIHKPMLCDEMRRFRHGARLQDDVCNQSSLLVVWNISPFMRLFWKWRQVPRQRSQPQFRVLTVMKYEHSRSRSQTADVWPKHHVTACDNTVHLKLHEAFEKWDCLTLRRLMSYIYGAPILDVSRSHTTTQHSR